MRDTKDIVKSILPNEIIHLIILILKFYNKLKRQSFELILSRSQNNFFLKQKIRDFNFEIRNFISLSSYSIKYFNSIKILNKRDVVYSYAIPMFWDGKQYNGIERLRIHQSTKSFDFILYLTQIIGNSNLLLVQDDKVIYETKSNDKDLRYIYTDGGIKCYNESCCLVNYSTIKQNFDKGIKLTSNYSWNYFHFLYEVLSKFYYLKNLSIDKEVPLLLDKIILDIPQYRELLEIFNIDNREIVTIEKGERYLVNELYTLADAVFIPPNFHKAESILPTDSYFDVSALNFMRTTLLKRKLNKTYPKRIFLSRSNASNRRKYNEDEVFEAMQKLGFVKVYPENYSIAEQVTLFNSAEYIAGTTGAAFSNILFCNIECQILCFTNYKIPFSGFSTIASFVGAKMVYIHDSNKILDSKSDLHDPFIVNVDEINKYFSNIKFCK